MKAKVGSPYDKEESMVKFIIDGGYIIRAPRDMTVADLIMKFDEMHDMRSFKGIHVPVVSAVLTNWAKEPANIVITESRVRLKKD